MRLRLVFRLRQRCIRWRAGVRCQQIRETVVEFRRIEWRTIRKSNGAGRCIFRTADTEIDAFTVRTQRQVMTQHAHCNAQRDVDYVVAWTTAIRKASKVSAGNTEGALLGTRRRRDCCVQAQHLAGCNVGELVNTRKSSQERSNQVIARKVARRQIREA